MLHDGPKARPLPTDLAQQHPQKADDGLGGIGLLLHLHEEAPI